MTPMKKIAVIGSSGADEKTIGAAMDAGREIAKQNFILLIGEYAGVMEASARGAKNAGGIVESSLSIFNYGMEKGRKAFEEEKVRIISLSDVDALLDVAAKQKFIREEEKKLVKEWVADPASWGKKMGFE